MLRKTLLFLCLILVMALAGSDGASAYQHRKRHKLSHTKTRVPAAKPVARPRADSSCAEFGASFIRVPDSDTCVRVGGSVSVEGGGRF